MTLNVATITPIRRFVAIAQRTRPWRAKRTGARYSPPPTPVKPDRSPMGKPNRPPIKSPSRRSARDGGDPAKRLGDGRFLHVPFPSPNPIFTSEDPARPHTRAVVGARPVER